MATDILRVLMTADTVGGVWTYALDLARALSTRRVRALIATMGPAPGDDQRRAAEAVPNLELVAGDFRLEWMDDPWDDVARAGRWLLDLERRFEPHVVHLNGYAHGSLPFRAPVVVAGHSCLRSWADAVPGAIDDDTLRAYTEHVAAGLRAAHVVAAPSRTMLAALQRHYGPLGRTTVVHNGRCAGLFAPGTKEPVVFTAGRLWDAAKNVDAVVAVAPDLPWRTVLAGDLARTPHEPPPVLAGVQALGRLEEAAIASWLARASIVALPARYEPFGLLPLEAALSGCALVLGDIPSLREVWADAADYVAPDDTTALRAAIRALIDDPDRLRRRAEAARSRAARYTVDRMAQGYLDAYQQAVAVHRRRGALSCAS